MIPKPIENMSTQWPLLYPWITGAGDQIDHGPDETARIREEVLSPLLNTGDLAHAVNEAREAYERWKESLAGTEQDPDAVLAREARFDDAPAATFEENRELLGDPAVKATLEILRLRKIVRESVIPYRETWPEESWERIAHLMTGSELCLTGILEFITTGKGSRTSVENLARRGFENALEAYWDAGYYGQDSTNLEDIPE